MTQFPEPVPTHSNINTRLLTPGQAEQSLSTACLSEVMQGPWVMGSLWGSHSPCKPLALSPLSGYGRCCSSEEVRPGETEEPGVEMG